MTHEGAPAVFVIHDVASVRAAIHGACDEPTGSIIGPIRCEAVIISTHTTRPTVRFVLYDFPSGLEVPAVL